MALTNEELQDIISNLSPEERKQLLSQLGRQVEVDNITNPTQSTNTKPKVNPKSDNSKVYCCPLCGSASYKKHGTTTSGMQRYICKDCGKTFSENYGDSLRYSHLASDEWLDIIRGIVNNHSLPQIANHQHICILTAIDRNNNIYIEPATAGTAKSQDVYNRLTKVISKDSVFITDDHHSYKMFCRKERIEHVIVDSGYHVSGAYSLSKINSLHSGIERFFGSKEYFPATKYIDLYLKMFWWLQKNKDCSTKEMTDKLFRIMTGHVDNSDRAKMSRVTIKSLVSRKMPIDTKEH